MEIVFSDILADVKRHLSIIGKRLTDDQGKNLFSNITVSTAEDPIFNQYILAGVQSILASCRQLVTSYNVPANPTSVTLTLTNTRGSSDFDAKCKGLSTTYITLFSVAEYLSMTRPDVAEKYQSDAIGAMQNLMTYVFYKEPPVSSGKDPLTAITTTVTQI